MHIRIHPQEGRVVGNVTGKVFVCQAEEFILGAGNPRVPKKGRSWVLWFVGQAELRLTLPWAPFH